jgi:hypothetical protein
MSTPVILAQGKYFLKVKTSSPVEHPKDNSFNGFVED